MNDDGDGVDDLRYYRVLQPEVRTVYSAEDAPLLAIKNRHDGPRDESEALKG